MFGAIVIRVISRSSRNQPHEHVTRWGLKKRRGRKCELELWNIGGTSAAGANQNEGKMKQCNVECGRGVKKAKKHLLSTQQST